MRRHGMKRKPSREPIRLNAVIGSAFPGLGLGSLLMEHEIKKNWQRVIGDSLSQKTSPTRLRNKTLYVTVSSSAWMNELSFHKREILKKIGEIIGKDAVTEIIFKPGSGVPMRSMGRAEKNSAKSECPKRELTQGEKLFIEKVTSVIKDPELRKALKKAMENLKRHGNG